MLGADPVLGGLCGTLSRIAGPGHIRTVGSGNFIKFGELDNRPELLRHEMHGMVETGVTAARAPFYWNQAQPVPTLKEVPPAFRRPFPSVTGRPTMTHTSCHSMIALPISPTRDRGMHRGIFGHSFSWRARA